MSKIICNVCGTAYPDTADQCPICGYAKPEGAVSTDVDSTKTEKTGSSGYTYVKGGRFSKANVRKRNEGKYSSGGHKVPVQKDEEDIPSESAANRGLVIAVLVLLMAIVAVAAYIGVRFFLPSQIGRQDTQKSTASTTASTAAPTSEPTAAPTVASCTDLMVSDTQVELTQAGAVWLLNVVPVPEDTVDTLTYQSSNPEVASVNSEGRITAVAPGEAVITVTCGSITKECIVTCAFDTEPTQPPTTAPTLPDITIELNREDITMSYPGESWQLYEQQDELSADLITWTTDDSTVATIEGGVVTAVGNGTTEVHGVYNGQEVTCIIRCDFS